MSRISNSALSVRVQNVCSQHNIVFVGDLIRLSASELLRFPNFGRESLAEVKSFLGPNLSLGMSVDGWSQGEACRTERECQESASTVAPGLDLLNMDSNLRGFLLTRVAATTLSVRVQNVCSGNDILFVGELAQFTDAKLLAFANVGRHSVAEVRGYLSPHFPFGTPIRNWSRETALILERENAHEIREALSRQLDTSISPVRSLEDELHALIGIFTNEHRKRQMILCFAGWDGSGAKTLDAVGERFAVTRERVRQVTSGCWKRLRSLPVAGSYLQRAVEVIVSLSPCTQDEIDAALLKHEIVRKPFHVTGIMLALKVLGRAVPVEVTKYRGTEFVVARGDASLVTRTVSAAARLASKFGCANAEEIAATIKSPSSTCTAEFVRRVLRITKGARQLDQGADWFTFVDRRRNRLTNQILKVFSVAPSISVSELRSAVSRHHRMAGFAPPRQVLANFVALMPGCRIANGFAINDNPPSPETELGGIEYAFYQAFVEHGRILPRTRLEQILMHSGINPATFYIYLGYSPIITRLRQGVYSLVATQVAPGELDLLRTKYPAKKRISDHGWTSRGELWAAFEVTFAVLSGGVFILPAAVRDFLEGNVYALQSSDGASFGEASARNGYLTGLRKYLRRRGLEAGDIVVLVANLQRHTMLAVKGGEEIVEQVQQGQIEELVASDPD